MTKKNKKNKFLLFMHIPKTGGQSLRGVIKRQYELSETFRCPFMEEKVLELPEEFRNSLKFIYGHFLFGTHEYFPKPFTYISMMRDPVDRFISAYYHIIRVPTNRWHEKVKNLTLEEFIDSDDFNLQAEPNIQTRFFCGKEPLSLETAKKNMDEYFSIVGITESFGESLFLMKEEFKWGNINYRTRNAAPNRPRKNKVSKEVWNKIAAKNQLDIELYEYAKKRLEEKIQAMDEKKKKEMKTFKEGLGL
nr:sulfotransferase family 2 domain-containing protein [Fredinandcohnia onubensis]